MCADTSYFESKDRKNVKIYLLRLGTIVWCNFFPVVSRLQEVLHPSPTETIPLDIFEHLCSLEVKLTKGGSFEETIEKMEDREVEKTIDDIVGLLSMVARAYPEESKGQLSLR